MNQATVIDLVYLNDTIPTIPSLYIPRDNYFDAFETALQDKNVFFLNAEEGVGVTTTLALFAKHHNFNCISYFNNGLVSQLLDPEFIERCLIRQLYFFINNQVLEDELISSFDLEKLYVKLGRKLRDSDQPLYFIFDGFDDIPPQSIDNIKSLMQRLPWDKGKFIFSGRYDKLKDYLPKKIKYVPDQVLQKFSRLEVISFLKEIQGDLTDEDYDALYKISGCVASQLNEMLSIYKKHQSFSPILKLEDADANDLFSYHFRAIENSENKDDALEVLALIAFISQRLPKNLIKDILDFDDKRLDAAIITCENYLVTLDDHIVAFNTEYNQRYVRKKLDRLRQHVELLFIQKCKDNPSFCTYIPVLLKSRNDKKGLVQYLNSEVVMNSIMDTQSQAVLNEQCEMGFTSIDMNDSSQTSSMFNFALYKSSSREIEQNELWDNQIEALLEVGYFEKAFELALSVYLKEERLKALLLIARRKERIPSHVMDEVRSKIIVLVEEINFEYIPDKSMELAKLMFPYDFKVAVDIIERVAKVSKDRLPIDKLYAILSISSGQEKGKDSCDVFDVITSKIENDELKMMTKAARSIFNKTEVDDILEELKELPSILQGLLFLQYWIPEHSNVEGIGKIVIYAIKSVISISNVERPKVSFIRDFCTPLPQMRSAEINQVIVMLDSFQSILLTPSTEFVRLELIVIEALFTFDSKRACERLQELYLLIDDFENKSIAVACKSIILGKYDNIGDKEMLENELMPAFKLQQEIETEIIELLEKTAYHLKIVEGPIRSLVVNYRSSIDTIIRAINTQERRSRSYMIAAESYCLQVIPEKWDWEYLMHLINKIDYDKDDCSQLVYSMAKEIVHSNGIDADFLKKIKKHHQIFFDIEQDFAKISVLSNIYVLFKRIAPEDTFLTSISNKLSSSWEKVDLPWIKVNLGFLIAKTIACVSVDEAKKWIEKVSYSQKSCILASYSSVTAFQESIDLYIRSLGILIRSKLITEKMLDDFSSILDGFASKSEEIIAWSKIALYYLLDKDRPRSEFEKIFTKHVSNNLENFSDYYKKYILFHSAPSFFYGGDSFFFALLENLDIQFKDLCISRVAKFIFIKHVEINDAEPYRGAYKLTSQDYNDLINLLEHCVSDSTFFGIFDCVCESLQVSKSSDVSSDQKLYYINQLSSIVEKYLPMKGGIKHDGYKIACKFSLSKLQETPQTQATLDDWESQIALINNIADRVFLYVHASHYIRTAANRQIFINKASELIKAIPSSFDQSSRLDFCIDECRKNTKGLTKEMIGQFINIICSDSNGRISEVIRAYDCIYDYSPELADVFLEKVDTDPARSYYKAQLTRHSERTKRIASAKENYSSLNKLSTYEQKIFFANEVSNQISQKATIHEISDTIDIMKVVFSNPISEVHDALNYFLENVYLKHKLSNHTSHGKLILGLHDGILFNLKLVLALSSGTKEKLARIGNEIGNDSVPRCPSVMPAGDKEKVIKYIKEWYTKYPFDDLYIIDAYFSPNNLYLLKMLFNINNNLCITIITHRSNVSEMEDYQDGWNNVSSDLTGTITIHALCYEKEKSKGPLHDRWWISKNNDENLCEGIKLNSISGFGKKDFDISRIDDDTINDIELLAMNYALEKRKRVNNELIIYEKIEIKRNNHNND